MGKKEKLIARLKSVPKDFTFDEMKNLLELLDFKMSNKGRTSGSRVQFKKEISLSSCINHTHVRSCLSTKLSMFRNFG